MERGWRPSRSLLDTPRVKDLILKGEIGLLKETMAAGYQEGMQTFDQHIHDLYRAGRIDYENAMAHADSPNDLRLRIRVAEAKKEEEEKKGKASLKLRIDER